MPTAPRAAADSRYRTLFPDWSGPRPVRWFFAREFLEARGAAAFRTNVLTGDEDVNIYLIHLLTGFLEGRPDARVQGGAWPLLLPPDPALPRRARADHYRVNGDHRLLMLGLMDRGDGLRRRATPWGVDPAGVRARDLAHGAACYRLAADLAAADRDTPAALARVLDLLAAHFEEYVHVLAVLATRRLGLGARLDDGAIARLADAGAESAEPAGTDTVDGLLDALAAWRSCPTPAGEADLRARAAALGIDPGQLGLAAA